MPSSQRATSPGSSTPASVPSSSAPVPASSVAVPSSGYYVSIGDSYAAGYQPTSAGVGHTTTQGFANDVVSLSRAKSRDYTLVNFGCGGATSDSLLHSPGCASGTRAVNGPDYTVPQAQAAEDFMHEHPGKIALVTVSIGGNDAIPCGAVKDTVGCLTSKLPSIAANIKALLAGVRSAAGARTPIVGITYPDVFLGEAAFGAKALGGSTLPALSVMGFQELINPTLKGAYAAQNARFADVTAATGAYGSMSDMMTVKPYGTLPSPVARVCELTYYCQWRDIHPRPNGYALIAKLVVSALG